MRRSPAAAVAEIRLKIPFERVLETIEALRRATAGLNNAKLQAQEPDLADPRMDFTLEIPGGVTISRMDVPVSLEG